MVNVIAEIFPGGTVMKFKSEHLLQREARDNWDRFDREIDKAFKAYELVKVLMTGGDLSKAASGDLELAKSDIAHLKATYGDLASDYILNHALLRLTATVRECTTRAEQNKEERRRSRRFNQTI